MQLKDDKIFKRFLWMIIILFSGCSSSTPPLFFPETTTVSIADFTEYGDKGFLFSPNVYEGEYKSIGLIEFILYPEASKKKFTYEKEFKSKYMPETYTISKWIITDPVLSSDLVDMAYQKSVELGADALVSFDVNFVHKKEFKDLTLTGIKVSGYAIKRLD